MKLIPDFVMLTFPTFKFLDLWSDVSCVLILNYLLTILININYSWYCIRPDPLAAGIRPEFRFGHQALVPISVFFRSWPVFIALQNWVQL